MDLPANRDTPSAAPEPMQSQIHKGHGQRFHEETPVAPTGSVVPGEPTVMTVDFLLTLPKSTLTVCPLVSPDLLSFLETIKPMSNMRPPLG